MRVDVVGVVVVVVAVVAVDGRALLRWVTGKGRAGSRGASGEQSKV